MLWQLNSSKYELGSGILIVSLKCMVQSRFSSLIQIHYTLFQFSFITIKLILRLTIILKEGILR